MNHSRPVGSTLGRPTELPTPTLKGLEVLYRHNIRPVEAARQFNLSRQLVYYYYKRFKQDGVVTLPTISIPDLLQQCELLQCELLQCELLQCELLQQCA